MRIKKKSLSMNNVICITGEMEGNEWVDLARDLRDLVISHGLYPTGPLVYQREEGDNDKSIYRFYMPVNNPIILKDDKLDREVTFLTELYSKEGLVIRHAEPEEGFESDYIMLESCAAANKLKLKKPYYHICMNMYGEQIVDVFAPLQEV